MNMFKHLVLIAFLFATVTAMAQKAVEPIKSVKIGKNREFVVNGKPFFPIINWVQPVKNYKLLAELGFNTCGGDKVNPVKAAEVGCYAATSSEMVGTEKQDHVIGLFFDDEPDMPRGKGDSIHPKESPELVAAKVKEIRAKNPDWLLFMTLTGHFTKEESRYPVEMRQKLYPQYIQNADIFGFDNYPIYGSGYASHLNWVGSGTDQLRALAGNHPIYVWIETSKGSRWMPYAKQPDVLPIHTRNEVWQAIIHGATAIAYFTHAWFPEFREFAPTPEMQQELKRLNNQITRLAPAILADPAKEKIEMKLGDNLDCSFKATNLKGSLYIFAENNDLGAGAENLKQYDPISPRTGKSIFSISGLKAGTKIEVVDENRTITAEKGQFTDEFGPLAEHIYRMKR
jgi:hypothetical protein